MIFDVKKTNTIHHQDIETRRTIRVAEITLHHHHHNHPEKGIEETVVETGATRERQITITIEISRVDMIDVLRGVLNEATKMISRVIDEDRETVKV